MSPLAKFFVVVNLVLGVAFFGGSATLFMTRVNWREAALRFRDEADKKLAENEKLYKNQGQRLQQLEKDHARLNTNYNSVSAANTKLQTELVTLKGELASANLRIDTEVKEKTQLNSRLQDLDKKNTDLTQQVDTVRKEAEDAKGAKELAVNEMTRIRLDVDKLNDQHSKLLMEHKELQDKAETMNIQIAGAQKAGVNFDLITDTPPIDAVVQMVDDKKEARLVVLSVGRDQKVQEGFKFTVYRGDRFVGKVQVIKVYDDLAGARILFTNENEAIQVGDRAATQL
jgi:predicted nuclease with TOPRIM domain